MLIYNCLIYSNIIYCNSIWGFCKKNAIQPLLVAHKKIIRAIAVDANRDRRSRDIFNDLHLLNLENINKYMSGIFVYKCLNDHHFSTWFNFRVSVYQTRAMEARPLEVPLITNLHSEQMISYRGAKLWNEIPTNITDNNYNSFKILYKTLLLSNQ